MANSTKKAQNARQSISAENELARLEFEILSAEFLALRDEILNRLSSQQQTVNFTIALIAAAIALRQLIPVGNRLLGQSSQSIYLLLSIIFSGFALMHGEHDLMMADIGSYINKSLRPKIHKILEVRPALNQNEKVLGWDEYLTKIRLRSSFASTTVYFILSLSRYLTAIIPSIGLIAICWIEHPYFTGMTFVEIILFYLSALISLTSISTLIAIRKRYTQID